MSPIACNDAELAAILAPPVMQGLKIVGEQFMEPEMSIIVNMKTGRGNQYSAGGAGSLSQAWTTQTSIGAGMALGTMEFYFDKAKAPAIIDPQGQHITPRWINNGDGSVRENKVFIKANNIAAIIDEGLGGMKLGPDNPTRQATHFWDLMLNKYRSSERRWITAGLRSAGLPVM